MEDAVEVHLGDLAQISCRYSFTDVAAEPSDVIVQWFVVSPAKADTAPSASIHKNAADASASACPAKKWDKPVHSSCQNANKSFTAWSRSRSDAFMDSAVVFFG